MSLNGVISGPCAHNPPFFNDVHSFLQNIMGELTRMRESVDEIEVAHQKEVETLRKDIEQECQEARDTMNKFRYEFDEMVHRRVESLVEGLETMERKQRMKDHHQQRQIDDLESEVNSLCNNLGRVGATWKRVKHNSLNHDAMVRSLAAQQHLPKPGTAEKPSTAGTSGTAGSRTTTRGHQARRESALGAAIYDLQRQKAESDSYELAEQVRIRLKGAAQYLPDEDWQKHMREHDTDHSGQMNWPEFRTMCREELKLQEPDASLKLIFDCLDFDSSGEISVEELINFVSDPAERMRARLTRAVARTGNDWQKIIDEHDLDQSGQISLGEFRRLCRNKLKLPEKEIHLASVFKHIDADHSGEVSLRELTAWVQGRR